MSKLKLTTALLATSLASASAQTIDWSDLNISDGTSLPPETAFSSAGVNTVIDWSSNFTNSKTSKSVSYRKKVQGGEKNTLSFSMDIQGQDNSYSKQLIANIKFSQPLQNAQFSILDVDSGGRSSFGKKPNLFWDDGVEVYINGLNVRDLPQNYYSLGSSVSLDDKIGFNGFEGNGSTTSPRQTNSNIYFDFSGIGVKEIELRYFSTSDSRSNPNFQNIGISQIKFNNQAIPEPSSVALLGLGSLALILRRKR